MKPLILLACIVPWPAYAQLCVGDANFRSVPVQVGANYASHPVGGFRDAVREVGVEVGVRIDDHTFARGLIARREFGAQTYYDPAASFAAAGASYNTYPGGSSGETRRPHPSTDVGIEYAYSIFHRARSFGVCPLVSAVHEFGPRSPELFPSGGSTDFLSGGVSAGKEIAIGGRLHLLPFFAGRFVNSAITIDDPMARPYGARSTTVNYGVLDAGIGFELGDALTIRPSVTRPFGNGATVRSTTSGRVGVMYNFGKSCAWEPPLHCL